jgi:riboflavin synthase
MFTGIIEKLGKVVAVERRERDGSIQIDGGWDLTEIGLGDSICVNGACLTVSSVEGTTLVADVSAETLGRTNLGGLRSGESVNLERALRLSDRLGGHLVMGHVDGTGTIHETRREGDSYRFEFEVSVELSRTLVEKGSVAVDGISLTVSGLKEGLFQVYVIPYTLERTTLKLRKPGDPVNIETDIIGKYVEKILSPEREGLTLETLRKSGFLEESD